MSDFNIENFLDLTSYEQNRKGRRKGADGGKKFDVCLMNPPYSDYSDTFLDINFVEKVNNIVHKGVYIYPSSRLSSKKSSPKKQVTSGHLKEVELYDAAEIFNIKAFENYVGVYVYDNDVNYDKLILYYNGKQYECNLDPEEIRNTYHYIFINDELVDLIKSKKYVYDNLFDKYGNMCEDHFGLVYEENKHKKKTQKNLLNVKQYLKDGTYKYCIYKGSFNHNYDAPQEWVGEDPYKLFKGQICWLTNKENVKNNLKYWLSSPVFELYRKYKFNFWKGVNGMAYKLMPAVDFDQPEEKFKNFVDSLINFSKDDIKAMIKFNVHNADKL